MKRKENKVFNILFLAAFFLTAALLLRAYLPGPAREGMGAETVETGGYDITAEADEASQDAGGEAPGAQNGASDEAWPESEAQGESGAESAARGEPDEPLYVEGIEYVPADFFNDTLFIGDSRMVGLGRYGKIVGAYFFCDVGLSVYKAREESAEVAGVGRTYLENMLSLAEYKKIYVMFGVNELGYNKDRTAEQFAAFTAYLKEKQPGARIYIMANLHFGKELSDSNWLYNNANVDELNSKLAALSDGDGLVYIDPNGRFDDGEGNLAEEYTGDDTHLLGRCNPLLRDWLIENAA